jgi:hypothetical protein
MRRMSGSWNVMAEELFTLHEMMLYVEQFLNAVERASKSQPKSRESEELRLKIGHCRNILSLLQDAFNENKLDIGEGAVQEQFRSVIMILHWVAFYAREVIDYRTFRRLVIVDAGFTRLLIARAEGTRRQ